jgi:hypothetical protein
MKYLLNRTRWLLAIALVSVLWGKSTKIKVFHIFNSFGVETQEIKNSIVLTFDKDGFLVDSTIYTHTLPLSEKYVYVLGPHEGLKLQRTYEKEILLSYRFKNDFAGNRVKTSLYGMSDTLYWTEFQKFDHVGRIIKRIRYNPKIALNPEMKPIRDDPGEMIWGESYDYDSTGTLLEQKELYEGYILEVTSYALDSLRVPHKIGEYFDPSVLVRVTYFYNQSGQLAHEVSVERMGKSVGSKTYEYDDQGRTSKINLFNSDGVITETINTIYDDASNRINQYHADSTFKILSEKETQFNQQGRPVMVAFLDGEERLIEKKVYSYTKNGRIDQIIQYDTIRRGAKDREIPFRVMIYEYE